MAGTDQGSDIEMEDASNKTDTAKKLWRARTKDWYRHLNEQTYFLTPVYMNKTRHREDQLASGLDVLVTERPLQDRPRGPQGWVLSENDVRDDKAVQRILECLRKVSKNEVMFVVSQLRYQDYLSEARDVGLPSPKDLKSQNKHQGDFDILIIHRQHGILVGEMKAVGDLQCGDQQNKAKVIKDRVEKAIAQLKKATDVLEHILSDLQPTTPQILKTVMLPNVSRADLQHLLRNDPQLAQDLCNCLNIDVNTDPTTLCLTSNDISSPSQWWQQRMKRAGDDSVMTDDVYLDLVSRFAGPATTVSVPCSTVPRLAQTQHKDVRTPGEGVAEAGDRFAPVNIVLHPSQVEILNNRALSRAFLTGPPGTGKSLMLLLKGQERLRQGKPVNVVSSRKESRAASYMIASQLKKSEPQSTHLVHVHIFNMPFDRMHATSRLIKAAKEQGSQNELFVIMDEASDCHGHTEPFHRLCDVLFREVGTLHLWAASLFNNSRPSCLTEVRLTEALRTPPMITRLVQEHRGFLGQHVYNYTDLPTPAPADGHPPQELIHEGEGHAQEKDTPECEECGKEIARQLRHLHVGEAAKDDYSPTPPKPSDVFLLTYGSQFRDDSGLIRGLRDGGFPVTVLEADDEKGLEKVASMRELDKVVAANCITVNGLERKIVIFVQHDGPEYDSADWGKLWAMSRCTSLLMWLKRSRPQSGSQRGRTGIDKMEH
ncbi:uncharacterized protein [Littorina saxatilis]|uniref:Uncharacterized protein n=2 Tax=Littorina saxatilis TaxID=31220 RepID=A0AAN9AXD0_9CAEN